MACTYNYRCLAWPAAAAVAVVAAAAVRSTKNLWMDAGAASLTDWKISNYY